jgi:hypothetical protein
VSAATAAQAHAQETSLETKLVCARAAEKGQRLTASGSLIAARSQLRVCAADACPSAVKTDCLTWLAAVDRSIPSVVIHVEDATGKRVGTASIAIDGEAAPGALGRAVELDPGEHVIAVVAPQSAPSSEHVVVGSGAKAQEISIRLPSPPAPGPQPAVAEPHAPRGGAGPFAWTTAGLAVAAAGSFAYFGSTGTTELNRLRSDCAGHCAQSDVTAAWNKLIVADVSLGVAVVSGVLSTVLFLVAGGGHDAPPSDSGIGVAVTPRTAALDYRMRF